MLVITNTFITLFGYEFQSYGGFLVLALLAFLLVFHFYSAPRLKMFFDETMSLVLWGTIAAIIGGRIAYLVGSDEFFEFSLFEMINVWSGGLSVLGALIAVPIMIYGWIWIYGIDGIALADEICKAMPIADFFGRLGCLFGGCCYGDYSNFMPIMYQDSFAVAPCDVPLFPVQALTALLFLALFCAFLIIRSKFNAPRGAFTAAYFSSASFIRFGVDFFRGDRGKTMFSVGSVEITSYQFWYLVIGIIASVALIRIFLKQHEAVEAL